MNDLKVDQAKMKDYLQNKVRSVDSVRNAAFEAGARYQVNEDLVPFRELQAANAKLQQENDLLKAQVENLQNSKPAAVIKTRSKRVK